MSIGRLAFVVGLALAGGAQAQAVHPDPVRLQVFLAGASAAKSRVREEIQEILARAGLTAELDDVASIDPQQPWASATEAPDLLGRAWLDLAASRRDRATIHLRDCLRQRVLVRSLPLADGWDEVASEEVVHIVATSLMALAQGVPWEASPPPAAVPEPPAPPPQKPRTWMVPGLGMGAVHLASEPMLAGAGEASFLLGRSRAALWSSLAFSTTSRDSSSLHLRLHEVSLAALPAWVFVRARWVRGTLGLGPRIGVLIANSQVNDGAVGLEADATGLAWQASLRAALRVDFVLLGSLSTYLAATCDLSWPRYRYTVTGGGQGVTVIETVSIRPALWLGLAYELFGKEAS